MQRIRSAKQQFLHFANRSVVALVPRLQEAPDWNFNPHETGSDGAASRSGWAKPRRLPTVWLAQLAARSAGCFITGFGAPSNTSTWCFNYYPSTPLSLNGVKAVAVTTPFELLQAAILWRHRISCECANTEV